jgi:hypothetical protein
LATIASIAGLLVIAVTAVQGFLSWRAKHVGELRTNLRPLAGVLEYTIAHGGATVREFHEVSDSERAVDELVDRLVDKRLNKFVESFGEAYRNTYGFASPPRVINPDAIDERASARRARLTESARDALERLADVTRRMNQL